MEIRLENIKKNFGNLTAVDDLNLLLESGKLISFLGPSGCGKSTTLNMIAGIVNQDSGSIYFNDLKVNKVPTQKRNIGMIFQNYALYPHMSVYDNIAFPLKIKGQNTSTIKKEVDKMVEILKIENELFKLPGQLSGGQQQRVAIARALIKKPDALLMDEPFSNLDKKLRVETREEIKKLQNELGISTIFVTHDQEEASSISDYILLMNEGKEIQFGTPNELYYNPSFLFTAKFIGDAKINEFEAIFNNDKIKFLDSIELNFTPEEYCSSNLIIAIRPENFIPCDKNPMFKAEVIRTEMLGKDNLVTSLNGSKEIDWFVPSDLEIVKGNNIGLDIDLDKVFVFEANTRKRIRGRLFYEKRD